MRLGPVEAGRQYRGGLAIIPTAWRARRSHDRHRVRLAAGYARLVPVTGARHVVHHVAMAVPTIVLPEARNALSGAADRWADLLRSLPDMRATIPGSRWTVGDAAAHVVMDLRTEALVAAGEAVSWAAGATSAPGTPRGAAELNAHAVTAEAERHPRALADMLVTAVGDFLAASAQLRPDHPMPSQYFQGDMALDLAGVTAAELGEVLVHGYDIAKATGRPWPVAADEARLALRAALRLTSAYVNPETARGHTGGYDLRIRGGLASSSASPAAARRWSSREARRSTATSWPRRWRCCLSCTGAPLSGNRSPKASCSRGAAGHGGPWASSNCSSTPNRDLRTHSPGTSLRRPPALTPPAHTLP